MAVNSGVEVNCGVAVNSGVGEFCNNNAWAVTVKAKSSIGASSVPSESPPPLSVGKLQAESAMTKNIDKNKFLFFMIFSLFINYVIT